MGTTNFNCPICQSQSKELFKAKDFLKISDQYFGVRRCLNCQIVFTFPVLNWEQIKKFYPKFYYFKGDRGMDFHYYRRLFSNETKKMLKIVRGKGKILDVGCSTGLRLEIFRENGFAQYYGIEPSSDADYAKEIKKLPVERKTLSEFESSKNSFDIITLYNVFEHLDDPVKHLKIIKNLLSPKGWLVMQTPNFNSWQARLFKNKWSNLGLPRHYFHFTTKTISDLLSQNGFKIKNINSKTSILQLFSWVFSFTGAGPQDIWQKEKAGKQAFSQRLWLIFWILISILPALAENIFNKGGYLTIYAQKQPSSD